MNIHRVTFQKRFFPSIKFSFFTLCILFGLVRTASAIEIYDTGAFLHSPSIGSSSLGHLDGVYDDFGGSGVQLDFSKNIDAFGYGSLQWSFVNNTGMTLADTWLFGYLDAEIDPDLNSSYNESGRLVSVDGLGSGDTGADSWEIDEPGFLFGDIYEHLFIGALDNTNPISAGNENDLALALGFYLGDLFAGDSWSLILNISASDIGGLAQLDSASGSEFFLNGTAVIKRATSVSEPSIAILMLLGLLSLFVNRRHFIR